MDWLMLLIALISIQNSSSQGGFQPCISSLNTTGFCIPFLFSQMCPVALGGASLSLGNCTNKEVCCAFQSGTSPSNTNGACGIKGIAAATVRENTEILPRITGNDIVSNAKEFCWNAYIFRNKTTSSEYLGSGTLVSEDTIVTTATLLKSYQASELYVLVGDLNSAPSDNCTQYRTVTSLRIHPRFSDSNLKAFDVGKLKLQSTVPIDGICICKICLPNANENFDGKICTVTGLGVAVESASFDMNNLGPLKKVDLPVVNASSCQQSLRAVFPQFTIDESQLCAGGELGKDACKGDGGAGLVCNRGNGIFALAGIVSGGFGCGRQNVPGIYAKVSSAIDFIKQ